MKNVKLVLRDTVETKKKDFSKSNNKAHIIEAAVAMGGYIGVGGTKAIPLPVNYSIITSVAASITRAKIKFTGDSIKDSERILKRLDKDFNNILSIDYDVSNKKQIYINLINNPFPIIITDSFPLTNENIIKLALVLIRLLSKRYVFTYVELSEIEKSILKFLKYLDKEKLK